MPKITVAMLKDQTGTPDPRPFLHCCVCGGAYSANAGDYFMAPPDHVFRCHGVPMALMTAKRVLTLVSA